MSAISQNKQGLKVLISGSILQLFLGILYVWSVFVKPVSEVYNWDITSVKLTASFMLSFFVVGILAGGKLQIKTGAQKVVLLGGLMLSMGMLATAFLPEKLAWLMYISYGVIGGFGVGAGYNAIITSTQKWFPQNRGFATGVPVCSFGFSTIIFAPLIETLIKHFGPRYTFIILSAAFLIVVVCLFRFVRLPDESGQTGAQSAALLAKKQFTMTQAIKTREFYFLTLSLMLVSPVYIILNPSFKTLAAERGLNESTGTAIVMLAGIANTLGRLGVPLLSDKIGREKTVTITIFTTALCAALLSFAGGFVFIPIVAIIAFCYGGNSGIYPLLTADYFGIKNVGANYGAVMAGYAISALLFPIGMGLIGNNTVKFVVLSASASVAVVLIQLLTVLKKKQE